MKKLSLLTLLVVFCLPLVASAQESVPKFEVFGGYSFLRLNTGDDPTLTGAQDSVDLNGFDASVAGNFTRHIGLVGEFGFYRTDLSNFITGAANSGSSTVLTFLGGPRVVLHRGRIEPFVQGLFGAIRASADTNTTVGTTTPASILSFANGQAGYAFAYAVGGGVDFRVNRRIAIRLGQIDYLGVNTDNIQLNNFRYSGGVVFRLANRR